MRLPAVPKTDRETILQAAVARLRQDGLASLSLRSLAGDVGIATNALYHYFPSRAHLEAALSEQAAQRLHAALERDVAKRGPAAVDGKGARAAARERITVVASGYLRFARREPHLYAAMLQGPCDTGEPQPEHNALWDLVCGLAGAVHGAERAEAAAVSLWALLHGTVSLQQSGALGEKSPDDCITFGLTAWLNA